MTTVLIFFLIGFAFLVSGFYSLFFKKPQNISNTPAQTENYEALAQSIIDKAPRENELIRQLGEIIDNKDFTPENPNYLNQINEINKISKEFQRNL